MRDLALARRVPLSGVTGSGKSTAAARLARTLELPAHLADDKIAWLPGWVERDTDEQRGLAAAIAAEPAWVPDCAYSAWRDLVLPRAQVVVALDYPRWVSLSRLVRRAVSRVVRRTEIYNGNIERLRTALSRESIAVWRFRSFRAKQRRMRELESDRITRRCCAYDTRANWTRSSRSCAASQGAPDDGVGAVSADDLQPRLSMPRQPGYCDRMNPDLLRGHLEGLLLALLRDEPGHGYALSQRLVARSGGELAVPEGSLYPALQRLEARGLVTSTWVTAEGRRRRVYKIAEAGRRKMKAAAREWARFSAAIDQVLGGPA